MLLTCLGSRTGVLFTRKSITQKESFLTFRNNRIIIIKKQALCSCIAVKFFLTVFYITCMELESPVFLYSIPAQETLEIQQHVSEYTEYTCSSIISNVYLCIQKHAAESYTSLMILEHCLSGASGFLCVLQNKQNYLHFVCERMPAH